MSSEIEIQPWSAAEYSNLALVQEVKKHPCLYNNTLPEYSRKDITGQIWKEIAEKFGCSVVSIKTKWKNLRTSYGRHVRKMARNKNTRTWYLAKYLEFLRSYADTIDSTSVNTKFEFTSLALNTINQHNSQEETEQDDDKTTVSVDSLPFLDSDLNGTISKLRNKQLNKTSGEDISKEAGEIVPKVTVMPTIVQCMKSSGESSRNVQPIFENPRRQFILSLLPEVHGMTEPQFFKFKRKLFRLIDDMMVNP